MFQEGAGTSAFYDDSEDALVIDNPEDPVPLILKPNGLHKMPPDEAETSCGEEWHMGTDSRLPATDWLKGYKLCEVCFTPHERAKAAAAIANEKRITGEHAPLQLRDFLNRKK